MTHEGLIAVPYDRDLHENFVLDSFRKSYRAGGDQHIVIAGSVFELRDYLRRPETVTLVAADEQDPDIIAAWASVRRVTVPVVLYAYTKAVMGRKGVATWLLKECGAGEPPWAVRFWTSVSATIAARGKPIYFQPRKRNEDRENRP